MKKTKWLCIFIAAAMSLFLFAGCGSSGNGSKQTAAAKQMVDGKQQALMTVDLTGGYSVEFASGAAYFYKGEAADDNEPAAFAYVITKKEYDKEIAYLKKTYEKDGELKDLGNGTYSYNGQYFFPSDDGFYIKVAVQENAMKDADSIYPRFSAEKAE